jgi:hypothetical protein
MDTILIFVRRMRIRVIIKLIHTCQSGLYAAFLSAFLIETLGRLEEDPAETTRDVLIHQTRMMRNTTLGPFEPQAFQPSESVVAVNVLLFASLAIILTAAFISILIKGWIRELDRGLKSISVMKDRAVVREYRTQGLERYKLPEIIALLPLLIYISLFLFSCGLAVFLFSIHRPSALTVAVVMGVGVLFYGITLSLSIVDGSAPFKSAISRLGSSIFRRFYTLLHTDRWYFQWVDFSPRFNLPRRVVALVAKALLWKPHTDSDLANFDHSTSLTLDRYHVARLSQEVETTVLNTVYILPRATASTVRDVQQSLATACGQLVHHVPVNVVDKILEPFMGCDISLNQARTIATLIVHQRVKEHRFPVYPEVITKTVIHSLKSSSDRYDNLLGTLVYMGTSGRWTSSDLGDLSLFAPESKRFTLSQISMILTSVRVYLDVRRSEHRSLAGVRIGSAILRYQELSIVELAFIIAHFVVFAQESLSDRPQRLVVHEVCWLSTELRDGKIFLPYLPDDAVLLGSLGLFNSFPSLIHSLASQCHDPKACGAFAIHFLIRVYQASPVVYRRIMGQLSYKEVREWAREVSDTLMDEAAHVILNSQGIPGGPSGILSEVQIQRYDQSLDPNAVDLDMPMVHATYRAAEWLHHWEMPFAALANVWLAIHAGSANNRQQHPIPLEHIQWVDHPISEMIALRHFSSFRFRGVAELTFINLCLHSTSFEVLLPAFQRYLQWLPWLSASAHVSEIPSIGVSWNEMLNVLSNALKVLLGPNLAPSQLLSFWKLVSHLCGIRWAELPDSWQFTFLQCFFSLTPETVTARHVVAESRRETGFLIDEPPLLKSEYLGIKWLENVWKKFLKQKSRTVVIGRVAFPWFGVEGGEWDENDEKVQDLTMKRKMEVWEEKRVARKEKPEQSATNVLQTLAKLLEAARLHGLVTVDLAGAISDSLLLADDELQQDQISLDCIKAIICPLLVPLPSTPPPGVTSFSCHMELP